MSALGWIAVVGGAVVVVVIVGILIVIWPFDDQGENDDDPAHY